MGKLKEKLIKENEKKIMNQPLWVASMSDFSYVSKSERRVKTKKKV